MSLFQAIGIILTLVAALGYLNYRFVRLPEPVGITAVGIVVSLVVAAAGLVNSTIAQWASQLVAHIDFTALVFEGMLGLLLFSGSLQFSWSSIARERWPIGILASVGVVLSTLLVGIGFYYASRWLGFPLPLIWCLLFGALISPTDPIAVMGVMRSLGVPKHLEMKITGESLFNDSTGVVVFIILLGIATASAVPSVGDVASLIALQVLGGVAVGLAVGFGVFHLLHTIDSYPIEILITLAMATGGYALAEALHGSGPIAVVLMGLVTGNQTRSHAMSDRTRTELFSFWSLLDEMLNLVLFALIGLEIIALAPSLSRMHPALVAIPLVLAARWLSVAVPLALMPRRMRASPHLAKVLTWGALRGGISVALALSLPMGSPRETIIGATYGVVIFSILVQALTLGAALRRWKLGGGAQADLLDEAAPKP